MMLSAALILIILLTSSIAYPHRQQLRHYGQQDVVLVTNYNYVTETTGVTAAIWVQGGVAPHAFVHTALKSIAESLSTDKSGLTLAIAVDRMSVDSITNPGFQCTYPSYTT